MGWMLAVAVAIPAGEAMAQAQPAARADNQAASSAQAPSAESLSKKVKSIVKSRQAAGALQDTEIVRD
ncbi:MAG: hypothetical protein ACRETD_12730, partial [Steroidobacteraceae bacterium]